MTHILLESEPELWSKSSIPRQDTNPLSYPPQRSHLILVGLPGSGKSTVGQAVAQRIGTPFLDFDVEIERRTGLTISRIFREHGEAHFRSLELDLTREVAARPAMILAPGGGWITVPGALSVLRPPARMIYLRTRPEVALGRMGAGKAARPLLQAPDPLAELGRLLAKREPSYRLADHVVDVDIVDLQEVIAIVSRLATAEREG
jgi:shikimate kinase